MNKIPTLGQMIGSIVAILLALLSGWIILKTEVAESKVRINSMEARQERYEQEVREQRAKQDVYQERVLNSLNEIKIDLNNKRNR